MKLARIISHLLRLVPSRLNKSFVAFCSIIATTALAADLAGLPSGCLRDIPAQLIPRQGTLTWESPNADGPIVAEHAELRFVLDNRGSHPLRILGIDTPCGCVKPVAEPENVPPGGKTEILANAITPVTGTRSLTLKVRTDSSLTPIVPLEMNLVVRRKPPFLYEAKGDLDFRGAFLHELVRSFSVVTFESEETTKEPELSTDLPFLKIQRTDLREQSAPARAEVTLGTPGIVRTRYYEVQFKDRPPAPSFVGAVTITDPFGRTPTKSLRVLGQLQDDANTLMGVPRMLTLHKQQGASASFRVFCKPPSQAVKHSIDETHRAHLSIKTDPGGSSRRVHRIDVVVVDPTELSDKPVRLTLKNAQDDTKATVLLNFVP